MAKNSDVEHPFYDVVIVGGGMVGATQAVALAKQNKRVLVIEKRIPVPEDLLAPPLRVSAINLASEQYLSQLDIWPHISPESKCMFDQLATWEKGTKPLVFAANDINTTHLGHLIKNESLQLAAFLQIAQSQHSIDIMTDCVLCEITQTDDMVNLTLQNSDNQTFKTIRCGLLIGADGAASQVRTLSDIGITGWDYQQQCLSITIKTHFETQHITWQEFQPSGPKAFLPLENGYSVLIWYDDADKIKMLSQLNSQMLTEHIVSQFPKLPGEFEVVKTASFPLTRRQANQYAKGRVVLIGDAAHTINPLAGQGVNIGYQDVKCLSQQLETIDLFDHIKLTQALMAYQQQRKREAQVMSAAMDAFYMLFSNDHKPLKFARTTLLNLASKFDWAKKQVLKKAVGY